MTVGSALTALTIGDLDGRHGHLEDFEPEPVCAGPLTELVTVRRTYVFNDGPEADRPPR